MARQGFVVMRWKEVWYEERTNFTGPRRSMSAIARGQAETPVTIDKLPAAAKGHAAMVIMPMSWRRRNILAVVLAILQWLACPDCAMGQGGPPLLTDDPGTPGNGKWEIDTAFIFEQTSQSNTLAAPLLDINYGLGDHVQLKYEVPWLFVDDDAEGQSTGIGPSLVGAKWRFLDGERHGFAMSVYPQVQLGGMVELAHERFAESGTNVLLPVEVGRKFGRFEVVIEGGYQFIQHGTDQWVLGLALGYPLSDGIELVGEIHSTMDVDLTQYVPLVNIGTHWELAKGCSLIAAVGHGFGNTPDNVDLLVYTGLQFNF